jgi:hypothetical protein
MQGHDDNTLLGALQAIADKLGGGLPGVPKNAYSDPREELLVLYSICTGTFNPGAVITIRGDLYTLDGRKVGRWEGVDEPAGPESLPMAFQQPPQPPGPFNTPNDTEVPQVQVLSWSKGIWYFDDGSTMTALGPAQLRAMIWSTGNGQLWVSADQIVTGGTGRYAGVQGLKTVSGTSWIPPGPGGSPPNFQKLGEFPARVIDVFRLVRAENIGPLPGPPPS